MLFQTGSCRFYNWYRGAYYARNVGCSVRRFFYPDGEIRDTMRLNWRNKRRVLSMRKAVAR